MNIKKQKRIISVVHKSLLLCVIYFGSNTVPYIQAQSLDDTPLPLTVVKRITEAWKNRKLGRYMDDTELPGRECNTVRNWPNWEGFDLQKCVYPARGKKIKVVMLNPSREVLIKWVVASCAIKYHSASDQILTGCSQKLLERIFGQSGSQFAIAGLVDETPGVFSFKDGLTVKLKVEPYKQWTKPITKEYQDASLDVRFPVSGYGQYARIASATRQQYYNYEKYLNRPHVDTTGENFLTIIRQAYQDAWSRAYNSTSPENVGKYRNDIIAAAIF